MINGAFSNLPYGGLIHLAGNTTFFTYNPINITGSLSNQPYWIIEGEGREVNSTVIQANATGFDTIVISNAARFALKDMRILGSTSGRAIYASPSGTAPNSFIYSKFDNLWVQCPNNGTQNGVMYLVNPFQSGFRNIFVQGGPTSWVTRIENTTALNYGNNHWDGLYTQNSTTAGSGCHCLSIASLASSGEVMNLNSFKHVQCVPPSSSVGPVGIYLGPGAQHNWFYGIDCEMGPNGIVIECASTSSNPCFDNHFFGGYGTCQNSNCIQTDANTYGCTFNKLCLGIVGTYSTGNIISDGNSFSSFPNVYEDIIMIGTGGSTPAINGTTRPIFRGIGGIGAARYFENYGTSTQSGNGSKTAFTITHNLVGKPSYADATNAIAGLPAISSIVPGATTLTVNYASPPATGTNNVVLNWYARF